MKHVRLPGYDAFDLDRLSYSNGDIVNDLTNATVRYMDGVTPGGFKLATQDYVQNNAITSANLATNLATALAPYALTSSLSVYATTTALNSAIAAIPIYSLPTATTSILGGVKVDGTSITVDPDGTIHGSNQYTLPIAGTSSGALGGVKVDGTTILINPSTGVISGANQYVLPTATTTVKGGVIIPAVATSGINNTSGTISLAQASTTQLGGVKVDGTTITINNSTGVISGANTYVLPAATTTTLGGVIIPAVANSGLTNTSGTIRLATATTNQLGGVKVDGVTITINGSGVIAANITGAIVFQGGWSAATNTPTLSNATSAYNTNGFEFVCTASGTVNFGLGNVTFAVGDNVIYDGTKWVKIPIGSSAGTTNNSLTFDNTGSGAGAGSTFNGASALTISYNTIGAGPIAGSTSITTLGTIATGTWNGTLIDPAYGGTGVANTYTLTVSGSNRTINQDVSNGSAPTFTATNFSGTASNLTVGNATNAVTATTATTATRATNIAGGVANQLAYQTAANATSFITAASGTNTFLQWTGSAFQWATVATATSATNLLGGAANRIHYQTALDTSGFIVAPSSAGTYLQWNGTSYVFSAVTGATGGTVTSVTGTGTVSGISLSGTVTSSGSLTLGGSLSLVSPGAIGGTTPSTGKFTTLQTTGTGSTTAAAGQIYLNGGTNNRIDFNTNGVAPPSFNSTSVGTKMVLYPVGGASSVDYAIGIDGSTMWFSTPTSSETFKWYGGTTVIASLTSAGALSATSFSGSVSGAVAATTLSASSTVSGTGFSTYLASPPAIGGTAAAAGNFTSIGATTSGTGVFTTLTATEARDTVYTGGSTTGTITPNAANGNIQTITLTGSITLNAFASPVSGQTITLIITQPAALGPYTLTSSMKFAGGFKTLSTAANAVDMLTISYIGTTYYASLVTGFA